MSHTTQQTFDQGRIDVIQQLHSFNASDVLPRKSQDESKKAKEKKKEEWVELLVSPIYPNLSAYCIEAVTARFLDHKIFGEQKSLLEEYPGKKKIIKNGSHDDTPHNTHLTDGLSEGSYKGPVPVQQQEKFVNVYHRKTSNFIAQLNINASNLDADIAIGEPISQFGQDVELSMGGNHPNYYLPTANFNDRTHDPNPQIDMNDVFEALSQYE